VERRSAENSVKAVTERKRDQIGGYKPHPVAKIWLKILLGMQHHVAGKVEANDAAMRKILQEKASQFSGAATGVKHALIAAKPEFAKHPLSPLKLRRGETMVISGIPFP
jgi:hypothetical protein